MIKGDDLRIFVTGTAGFIGFHLAMRLVADGHSVVGYDGMTPYYDVRFKQKRNAMLEKQDRFRGHTAMLEDKPALARAIKEFQPEIIIHLAAQAGVRYSIKNPDAYISSNIEGTYNLLEVARENPPQHLMLASTSSVYGGNTKMPFEETDRADYPVSLYAASKKATELLSHSYANLWSIPTTCFRFFTVYGPWGRPDMALFKFVDAIEKGQPIDVYGEGKMRRDFTYVDDLVEGIVRLMPAIPETGKPVSFEGGMDSLSSIAPWRAVNIAGGQPIGLLPFIECIEQRLGNVARKTMLPMQQGDVTETFASANLLRALTGFVPSTPLEKGVAEFIDWYRSQ
jgi:UDP-glucuronate 4-epimerase